MMGAVKLATGVGCVTFLLAAHADAANVRVRCEKRGTARSKISVDGNDLLPGSYRARVTSGANSATSGAQQAVGDQAEFDFDSDAGDIAAGATPIPANFIQGNQVTGQILNAANAVVAQASATCSVR